MKNFFVTTTRIMKKLSLFYFFLCITAALFSQNDTPKKNSEKPNRFRYITMESNYGSYFYSGNGLTNTGVLDAGYAALNVKFGWQPSSEDSWASMYGYPSFGIGLYKGFLGDSQVFGDPNAAYGFINFSVSNPHKRTIFHIEPAFGLTYGLKPYDSEKNPYNDAIGAAVAVYFSVDFGASYNLTRELDLNYGVDFTHFSNGRSFTPNFGLNMLGINLGLQYHYNMDQKKLNNDPYGTVVLPARFKKPESKPKRILNESAISIYTAIGTVQNQEDRGTNNRYGTFSGVLEYRYLFNVMHGISIGTDLFFDGSLGAEYPSASDHYLIGIHAGYDLMFGKFAIRMQGGTYLTDSRGKHKLFLRPTLQYFISKKIFAQVGLKTNGGADWAEFGIGIQPFKW